MDSVMKSLPMVALRGLTIMPEMVVHFDVSRERSITAVQQAMMEDQKIFLVAQKSIETEDPGQEDVYSIGTVATVRQVIKLPKKIVRVLVSGEQRGRLTGISEKEPYLKAEVELLEETDFGIEDEIQKEAMARNLREVLTEYADKSGKMSKEAVKELISIEDLKKLTNEIACSVPFSYTEQQKLLEELDIKKRYEKLCSELTDEIQIIDVKKEIQKKVKELVDRHQREYILREELKVIRQELGEDSGISDAEEFEEAAAKLEAPEEVKEKLKREISRFKNTIGSQAENGVIRTYIETLLEMPWEKRSEENNDIQYARKVLDEDHYGMETVKERILESLAVRTLTRREESPILCLVGPPGTGKTSIARSLARATNRPYVRISLGGVRDEAEIRGHRKTYVGAMPGRIANGIRSAGVKNPVLLLDEIDKVSTDYKGDTFSALLEVLDSEQNSRFRDHYLEVPLDLSEVMFITTANSLQTIPRPLLDRMEIIEIPSYTDEEKVQIAQRHLLPKERQAHGLTASSLRVDESAIRAAIALYTRESGVRSLERQLGKICRKAAMQLATSDVKRVTVTEKNIKDFLGAPRAAQEKIPEKDLVGVVNGLAWTEVGGEILPVEVGVMDGSGKVELTGNLGDVMQESCRAALSCLRQRAQELGIAPDFYKTRDIHIHFPEGAIPKDGPSAGIAIATAVLSALTGQAVHRDVAMTGEITLRGRVLAIGGLREKTMGALRAGVHTVILPKENEKDLDEIDPLVREKLRFVPVETVDAVFAEALVLPEKCTAAAHESYLPPVQESAHSALRAGEMS